MEHEFSPNDDRCVHCGTTRKRHEDHPQPCPNRVGQLKHEIRPEPARREYAINDQDTIQARLAELRAERTAAMNQTEEETG